MNRSVPSATSLARGLSLHSVHFLPIHSPHTLPVRMPDMNLSHDEATAVATHLLRDQLNNSDGNPNLASEIGASFGIVPGSFSGGGPVASDTNPAITTTVAVPSVGPGKGSDHFGIRLTSNIEILLVAAGPFGCSPMTAHTYI